MSDLVKVEVEVPAATWALANGCKAVVADAAKALANGWQPWDDVSALVASVTKNIVPVAGNVAKVPGELAAQPVAMAKAGALLLGELVGFAMGKLKKGA